MFTNGAVLKSRDRRSQGRVAGSNAMAQPNSATVRVENAGSEDGLSAYALELSPVQRPVAALAGLAPHAAMPRAPGRPPSRIPLAQSSQSDDAYHARRRHSELVAEYYDIIIRATGARWSRVSSLS